MTMGVQGENIRSEGRASTRKAGEKYPDIAGGSLNVIRKRQGERIIENKYTLAVENGKTNETCIGAKGFTKYERFDQTKSGGLRSKRVTNDYSPINPFLALF